MENLHCYCESGRDQHMLLCTECRKYFHPGCLKIGSLSPLVGDTFYHFICCHCSGTGQEIATRMKLQWIQVLILTLYNLQLQGGGKCGFFRWREHICAFIDKNWTVFFGNSKKKTSTWHGTVAGTLSAGSPQFFRSGAEELKESGWWSLTDIACIDLQDIESLSHNRSTKNKKQALKNQDFPLKSSGLRIRSNKPSIQSAIELKEKRSSIAEGKDSQRLPVKTEKIFTQEKDSHSQKGDFTPERSGREKIPDISESDSSIVEWNNCDESTDSWFTESDLKPEETIPHLLLKDDETVSEIDDIEIDPGSLSPIISSNSPKVEDLVMVLENTDNSLEKLDSEAEQKRKWKEITPIESDEKSDSDAESNQKVSQDVARRKRRKLIDFEEERKDTVTKCVSLTLYEEKQLLNDLLQLDIEKANCVEARILLRKLLLRQAKRERNIPLFNLDASVEKKNEQMLYDQSKECLPTGFLRHDRNTRLLDRYQVKICSQKIRQNPSFMTRLVGSDENELDGIISPYTARVLKPFIWRDYETFPPKLKLLREIVAYHHRNDLLWKPETQYPIDYTYVQPKHIASVNAYCQEFFWPGIDLSESLQYPDFSCIALYRKMIIGFSFMIPDVKYNEAYITFIFTHPEWRNAGIATFMLYHLIQTCMGKDVTLHVSASNSAVFLYQKFGFKVEEFIIDFYDKYYPIDSKECKHSLYLRLTH